jgi:hypothetical protein
MAIANARMQAMASGTARGTNLTLAVLPRLVAASWERRILESRGNGLLSEGCYVDGTANALVAVEGFASLLRRRFDLRGFCVRSRSIQDLRISDLRYEVFGILVAQSMIEDVKAHTHVGQCLSMLPDSA